MKNTIEKIIKTEKVLMDAGNIQHSINIGELENSSKTWENIPVEYRDGKDRALAWSLLPNDLEVIESLSGEGCSCSNNYSYSCTYSQAAKLLGGVEALQAFLEGENPRKVLSSTPFDWGVGQEGYEVVTLWKKQ